MNEDDEDLEIIKSAIAKLDRPKCENGLSACDEEAAHKTDRSIYRYADLSANDEGTDGCLAAGVREDLDRPKCENGLSKSHIENKITCDVLIKISDITVPRREHFLDIAGNEVLHFRDWRDENAIDLRWHLENNEKEFFDDNPKVWKHGATYVCLDGRMRMLVYRKKYNEEKQVPVDIVEGSIEYIKGHINIENAKPSKPYTKEEKDQAIWELILEDYESSTRTLKKGTKTAPYKFSEKYFKQVFGVSERSIRRKRQQLRELTEAGKDVPRKYLLVKWGIDSEKEGMDIKDMVEMMNNNFKRMEAERKKINNPFNSKKHMAEIYLAAIDDESAKELIAKYYGIDEGSITINRSDFSKKLKSRMDNDSLPTIESKDIEGIKTDPLFDR